MERNYSSEQGAGASPIQHRAPLKQYRSRSSRNSERKSFSHSVTCADESLPQLPGADRQMLSGLRPRKKWIHYREPRVQKARSSRHLSARRNACELLRRYDPYEINPGINKKLKECFLAGLRPGDLSLEQRQQALDILTGPYMIPEDVKGADVSLFSYLLRTRCKLLFPLPADKVGALDFPSDIVPMNDALLKSCLMDLPLEVPYRKKVSAETALNSLKIQKRILKQATDIAGDINKVYVETVPHLDDVGTMPLLHYLVAPFLRCSASLPVIDLVLSLGADVDIRDGNGETPLLRCLYAGLRKFLDSRLINFLMFRGASLEPCTRSMNPLFISVLAGTWEQTTMNLAVCIRLRTTSFDECRTYVKNGLAGARVNTLDVIVQNGRLNAVKSLLWFGVPASDVVSKFDPEPPINEELEKRQQTPLALASLCQRVVLLSIKDLTINSFVQLPTPIHVNGRLAATVGIEEKDIRRAMTEIEADANLSSYI